MYTLKQTGNCCPPRLRGGREDGGGNDEEGLRVKTGTQQTVASWWLPNPELLHTATCKRAHDHSGHKNIIGQIFSLSRSKVADQLCNLQAGWCVLYVQRHAAPLWVATKQPIRSPEKQWRRNISSGSAVAPCFRGLAAADDVSSSKDANFSCIVYIQLQLCVCGLVGIWLILVIIKQTLRVCWDVWH